MTPGTLRNSGLFPHSIWLRALFGEARIQQPGLAHPEAITFADEYTRRAAAQSSLSLVKRADQTQSTGNTGVDPRQPAGSLVHGMFLLWAERQRKGRAEPRRHPVCR